MGSRLHGNDGPAAAHPTIVIPTTAGIHGGHSRDGGNPRGGPAMGSRLHGNDGPAAAHPTIVIPAGIHGPHRHSRDGGNPRGGPAMGSRLHGNDGPAAAHPTIVIPTTAGIHGPTSSFPRRRESTGGGRRWVPVSTGTTGRRRRTPQSSFPRRRESTAGGRRWVPVSTGTTGRQRRTHNRHSRRGGAAGTLEPVLHPRQRRPRHSRDGGNPRGGGLGDGFPSPRERRAGAAHPTIVIPAGDGGVAVTLEPVLHPRLSR